MKDWETSKAQIMGPAERQELDWEASRAQIRREAKPEVQDSETLRARVAPELKLVEKLQSTARHWALIGFALLALLVALQLYTWMGLEELTTLGQQREERSAAAQATLQTDIERQRTALDQAVQEMASLGRAYPKAISSGGESGDQGTAAVVHEQLKYTKASKKPRAEHQSAPSAGTGRSVDVQDRPAAAREASSRDVSAMRQDSTAIYQDPSANRQGTSPPPTSQDLSAHEGLDGIQNEQHKGVGTSGMNSEPDTVIARDRNEIEKLRKLGERDYVEFTLVRSNTRQEVVPDISLQLRKVDARGLRCALSIYADDYEFPVNLAINEPVLFPIRAMWESVELVINKIGRHTVVGYLSARKGVLVAGR